MTILACGGNDSPSGPGDGNGDGETVTLMSGADPSTWEFADTGADRYGPYWQNGVFRSRAWQERIPPYGECRTYGGSATVISRGRLDLTRYRTARVTFRVVGNLASNAYGSYRLRVLSHVPGSPGLDVVNDRLWGHQGRDQERPVELSLENALGLREASIELYYSVGFDVRECGVESRVEIHDFRVEATE
jgi:hypothetical protein